MKNKFAIFVSGILLFAVLGCSITDQIQNAVSEKQPANMGSINTSNSVNKSTTDQVTEDVLREKTGVPECDELLDWLADQTKSNDDNFVSKGIKEYFVNKIRQSIKESIEKNQNDKTKMAKECKEIKEQIDAQKTQEESNK